MTTVAEEEVLTAAELDLAVDSLPDRDTAADAETGPAATASAAGQQPFLVVEKGEPTDEDVAALVAVLSTAANAANAGNATSADNRPINLWGRPTLLHRGTSPFSPYSFPELSHLRC